VFIAGLIIKADFNFPPATAGAPLAVLALSAALLSGRGSLLGIAIGALGILSLLEIFQGRLAGSAAVVIGAGLLASAEFGYWSLELQASPPQTQRSIRRRLTVIFGLVALGGALSALLLAITAART
jgi:hypothetical protein